MNKNFSQLKTDWEATTLKKVLDRFPERKDQFNYQLLKTAACFNSQFYNFIITINKSISG